MLNRVVEWARDRDLILPPGFKVKPVRWALVFDAQGWFQLVRELGDVEAKRNRGVFLRCPHLELGEMKSGGAGTRHFLVDNAAVVALLDVGEDDDKALLKHRRFVALLADAVEATPELAAAADTLAAGETLERIRTELGDKGARPTENITIEVRGADPDLLVEDHSWHDWYQAFRAGLAKERAPDRGPQKMRCLVSGELVEPVATNPKISGLADVGGMSMGAVLPAFKQESFRSYGLEQAANAAMSEEMAVAYTSGLNRLIREHSKTLAGSKMVFWYKDQLRDPADDPLEWIVDAPDLEEADALHRARRLLSAIRDGRRPDLAGNRYYALTLSANSSRVVLRDWLEGSFAELVANVGAWFDDLQIVTRDGLGMTRPPKLWAVLGSLVRELSDLPKPLVAKMWRVAVRNEPIPQQAMARALARFKIAVLTDQPVRTAGAGLLKAYLCRQRDREGASEMSPGLNENHPEPAYQCGRLMAVLDYLQYRALGEVGAGVVQRYFAAASATPALVLGRLMRLAQFHLGKLRSPGERQSFEYRIGQIMSRLEDRFPPPLSLDEQSLFALGYYHQKAHRPAKELEDNESSETEHETAEETT